jgi:hypothetical protein
VQMTAPDRERGVPNRELGTVERVHTNGRMDVRWDSGRTSSFEPHERRHLDYGYAVTSHSSQGQTAGRVLVHVETGACEREAGQPAVGVRRSVAGAARRPNLHRRQSQAHACARSRRVTSIGARAIVHTGIGARHAQLDLSKRIDRSHDGRRVLIRPRCSAVSRVPSAASPPLTPLPPPVWHLLLPSASLRIPLRFLRLAAA